MKYGIKLFSALVLFGMIKGQNPNDVIINEYNDNGGITDTINGIDMSREWVELLVVNGPVDMRNWYITDEEWSNLSISPGEGILQIGTSTYFSSLTTGTYIVIVKGPGTDDTDAGDGSIVLYSANNNIVKHGNFSLAAGGDGIALVQDDDQTPGEKDAGEVPIDYVSWGSERDVPPGLTWTSAISGTEDEDSYFSNGSDFNNDLASNWVTDAEVGGTTLVNRTPGYANPGQNDSSLPVVLGSFEGRPDNGDILLQWTTMSEVENLGFIIKRKTDDHDSSWQLIENYITCDKLRGHGSTSQGFQYKYRDVSVIPDVHYQYILESVDLDGIIHSYTTVSIKAKKPGIVLRQPKPNPFNPKTIIPLEVGTTERVQISVYNLRGRRIKILTDREYAPGTYSLLWDGTNSEHQNVASGIYFLSIKENGAASKAHPKLVLLR